MEQVDPASFKVDVPKADKDAPMVAVVGGGPAGLTAAHMLSLKGIRVTLFEKETELGGMLVSAIPSYRLPRNILKQEIDALLNQNITVCLKQSIGKDFTAAGLLEKGFKAVYLAIGAHESQSLGLEDENAKGIFHGLDLLKDFNLRGSCKLEGKVGIIGGGNSAMDAARVAKRQKNVESVTVFYRRTIDDMPAFREEVEEAIAEGIKIVPMVSPVKIGTKAGKLESVTFIRNKPGDPDSSGRPRPVAVPGSEYSELLDFLVISIGEKPALKTLDTDIVKGNKLLINNSTLMTGTGSVFAGGDLVTGPNTVVDAIASGKKAAGMIYRFVNNKGLRMIEDMKLPEAFISPCDPVEDGETAPAKRVEAPKLALAKRKNNFNEIESVITACSARAEAGRCLRCDLEYTQSAR